MAYDNDSTKEDLKHFALIHYGSSSYDSNKFNPICDIPFRTKPAGGLWTSPVNSKWGWRDWSESEDYGDLSSNFLIDFYGSVFVIDSYEDMLLLPWIEQSTHFVSFEGLFEYDAIHLTEKGQEDTRLTHPKSLYGWDCETVLIMNPDSIKGWSLSA